MSRGRVFAPCSSPVPHAAHFKNGFHCAGVGAPRSLDAGCIPLAGSGAGGGPAAAPGNTSTTAPVSRVCHVDAAAGDPIPPAAAPSSDGDFVLPCSCWASENESRCLIEADPSRFKVSS